MNLSRVCRFLGLIVLLFGVSMLAAAPWTIPLFGQCEQFDFRSFLAIVESMACCGAVSGALFYFGSKAKQPPREYADSSNSDVSDPSFNPDDMYEVAEYVNQQPASRPLLRKEAIIVVGLGWILAGILGAAPFYFSHTVRKAETVPVAGTQRGENAAAESPITKTEEIPMSPVDCLFESFSGVTGFGATVINDLETSAYVPRAILFWRCELHFLGGLGIMVLFVAILGGRSAGKSLMQTEMPYTPQESPYSRVQKTALALLSVYLGLNVILTILFFIEGMSFYDALCHSFSTVATGGFSTYNSSIGKFGSVWIEITAAIFMAISSCNFTLLYFLFIGQGKKLFCNTEFRVFIAILLTAIVLVSASCWLSGDFDNTNAAGSIAAEGEPVSPLTSLYNSVRYGGFQVISIMSSTGYGTYDYDSWNDFSRGILFLLMFTGACVGSTTCGLKIIRLVIIWKTLKLEIERMYRPNIVRVIHLQGQAVEATDELRRNVLSYFALYVMVFVVSILLLLAVEPSSTWIENGMDRNHQMYDSITSAATAYNCVGPSFGITGATLNFGVFHTPAKVIFIILMLMGRLELLVLFAIFSPQFWRS